MHIKTNLRTSMYVLVFISFYDCAYAQTYQTAQDGSWTDDNTWTTSAPPAGLSGESITISHIVSLSQTGDVTWDSNSYIEIEADAQLTFSTASNKKLKQKGGTFLLNNGTFIVSVAKEYEVDNSIIENGSTGLISVAGKLKLKTTAYTDTSQTSATQILNAGSVTVTGEIHNDGYISNTNSMEADKLHNDGYVCNTGTIIALTEIKLHENPIGFLACGGTAKTCKLVPEGGKIWNQTICCPTGTLVIDSSKNSFSSGDIHYASTNLGSCATLLSNTNDLIEFKVTKSLNRKNEVILFFRVDDLEEGTTFVIEKTKDLLPFMEVERHSVMDTPLEREYEYQSTDIIMDSASEEVWYYRLKVINSQGEIYYSSIQSIRLEGEGPELAIYPIPSERYFKIEGPLNKGSKIQIFNTQGQLSKEIELEEAITEYSVEHNLSKGLYFLLIHSEDGVAQKKLLVK